MFGDIGIGNIRRVNPFYFHIAAQRYTGMFEGIDYRCVAVANGGIFAGNANCRFVFCSADFIGEIAPFRPGLSLVSQVDSVLDFQKSRDLKIKTASRSIAGII